MPSEEKKDSESVKDLINPIEKIKKDFEKASDELKKRAAQMGIGKILKEWNQDGCKMVLMEGGIIYLKCLDGNHAKDIFEALKNKS